MNTHDKKHPKISDISSEEPQNGEIYSALDSFPMQAALGIYTMNRHSEDTENNDR